MGEIISIDKSILTTLFQENYIPVVSPIAFDDHGNSLNINADVIATELSVILQAEKLIFLTDIDGLLADFKDKNTLIKTVYANKIQQMIEDQTIQEGMIPKMLSVKSAIERGVKSIHIINGNRKHSILLELLTNQGIGTKVRN